MLKKKLGIGFVILGFLVFLYPIVVNYLYNPMMLENSKEEMRTIDAEEIAENNRIIRENLSKREASFNFDEVEFLDTRFQRYHFEREGVIGIIAIPAVELELPIFYGVGNNVLKAGAGTMKPDQEMGEGNYALAGHNSSNAKFYFAPVHRMDIGDVITVTDKKWIYTYQTTNIKIVDPSAVHVIEDNENINEITLVSCTKGGEQRLIVKGEFVKKEIMEDQIVKEGVK